MPTAAKTLRELLAVERAAGVSFDIAWSRSLGPALRACPGREWADWRTALDETRDAWAAAWAGEAPTAAIRALAAITDDPDREPLGTRCDHCDQPIPRPRTRGRVARFCSDRCRRRKAQQAA